MVKVDDYVKDYIAKNGIPPEDPIPIADVLGPDGHTRLTGFYKDPNDPSQYLPVDFEGGSITAPYDLNGSQWENKTIFPGPRPGRHP
jgi:hypothetical protein